MSRGEDSANLLDKARAVAPSLHAATLREGDGLVAWLEPDPTPAGRDRLGLLAREEAAGGAAFEGERTSTADGLVRFAGPLSAANARALRSALPDLAPRPLGTDTSVGFGDRLGVATPGHVRALRTADPTGSLRPVFAQQSIREMTRTGRSPDEVLTDATWGAFAAGWSGGVGADADHLKTFEDVDRCAEAGFSMFTFDPGDRVDDDAATASTAELDAKLDTLPWSDLRTSRADMRRRYEGRSTDVGSFSVRLDGETLSRAAAKYGAALAHAARMHRHLAGLGVPFEIEMSVDETGTPTSVEEHVFLALELRRLEVPLVSLAPRFVGRFEKGIDFRGSLTELEETLHRHAGVARVLGPYKLSLHSGSDKFSVYPLIAEATDGLVHLKTAGTSYLEALRVASLHAPTLFRDVLSLARERFSRDRASYHISAELASVPASEDLRDDRLPDLLEDDDARQVLHVTFGSALDLHRREILNLLADHREAHEEALERHFVRHLQPFVRVPTRSAA